MEEPPLAEVVMEEGEDLPVAVPLAPSIEDLAPTLFDRTRLPPPRPLPKSSELELMRLLRVSVDRGAESGVSLVTARVGRMNPDGVLRTVDRYKMAGFQARWTMDKAGNYYVTVSWC